MDCYGNIMGCYGNIFGCYGDIMGCYGNIMSCYGNTAAGMPNNLHDYGSFICFYFDFLVIVFKQDCIFFCSAWTN